MQWFDICIKKQVVQVRYDYLFISITVRTGNRRGTMVTNAVFLVVKKCVEIVKEEAQFRTMRQNYEDSQTSGGKEFT